MSRQRPRHRAPRPPRRRLAQRLFVTVSVVLALLSGTAVFAYKQLEGNIVSMDIATQLGDRPDVVIKGAINVLVMGSDTREGKNGEGIGGSTPGLSDTTLLLHLSNNRQFAYGVSLPRDAMVEMPACRRKNGNGTDDGGLRQFNAAYAIGGPACTVKTVEHLTGVRINHFIVVDFVGFKGMVEALDGVTMCVPEEVNDTVGHIQLPAGTYTMDGQQALDYVRVRHDLGAPTGDIGRMKRQQAFLSAMIEKVVSAGTLANPVRLYNFLNAATKSLTTDPGFANLKELGSLGNQLKGIGLDHVQFITVPWQAYQPDPNRVEWAPEAAQLWERIKNDRRLGQEFGGKAVTPANTRTPKPSPSPSASASSSPSPTSTSSPDTEAEEQRREDAEAAGLCT